MKDPISQDLTVATVKAAPPIVASAASVAQGWDLADLAVISTVIYTCVLTATTVIKNWGEWIGWVQGRAADLRRIWAWVRRRV